MTYKSSMLWLFTASLILWAFHFGLGPSTYFLEDHYNTMIAITGLVQPWCLYCWMREDAKERRISLPFDLGLLLIAFWPILAPLYLIQSRGRYSLLWIVLFLILTMIFLAGGSFLIDLS